MADPSHDLSDAQLVARCRQGDQAAWGQLIDRYSRYVYAIGVRAYGLREHEAEEVFQEVFARVYQQLPKLRDDAAVKPWIGQLTRRLCIDRYRAGRRLEHEGDAMEERADPAAADALDRLEDALTVRAALAVMPEACQDVLDRFFCRDETYLAISEATGIPSGTIASRISRCLARMRAALTGDEGRSELAAPSGGA